MRLRDRWAPQSKLACRETQATARLAHPIELLCRTGRARASIGSLAERLKQLGEAVVNQEAGRRLGDGRTRNRESGELSRCYLEGLEGLW